ncbi:MAG TPA: response regulator transcription factor [Acidimicrobiia bacterium]
MRVLVGFSAGDARSNIVTEIATSGFDVRAQPGDFDTAVERARTERPDVALLQSERPDACVAAAREILARNHGVAVVILHDDLDDDLLFAALEAGVAGVLPRDIDPTRLPHILRGVLSGEAAIPRTTMARVLREFSARSARVTAAADQQRLTPRQHEVLELLALGLSTSEIADALYISRVTVRTHVFAILHHLELPDRAAAVDYFSANR